jgi:hypothetical protein
MKKSLVLAIIPASLLLVIAGLQIFLAKSSYLTPWKGGGFGKFSTTDGNRFRSLRVFVSAPDRSEELLLKGKLEDLASFLDAREKHCRRWSAILDVMQ